MRFPSKRAFVVSAIAACALTGCGALQAFSAHIETMRHNRRVTAAQFELDVAIECTPGGDPRFAPCEGRLELVFTNTRTNERGRWPMTEPGRMHGALPVGDYEIALGIDGMWIGLGSEGGLGLVQLREGRQALGALVVRFVELPAGSFQEQAVHAERIRGAYNIAAVDFVHSPARGLLLVDVRLEGAPT